VSKSADLQSDIPLGTCISNGAASLESILRTDELLSRPSRPPDRTKENSALAALLSAFADSPRTILQTLADKVLDVLRADSAGLSLLTKDATRFFWAAIAGAWKPHTGGGTPRHFGPCGDVLDHNAPMLFTHWERRYTYLTAAAPLAEEGLVVPFYVNGKSAGTIWALTHNHYRKFDAEDLRLLESMSRFASAANRAIEDLEIAIAAAEKAEGQARELSGGLDALVRARTAELELRNKQLLDARASLAEEKQRLERSEAYMAEAQRLSHTGSWHLNVETGENTRSQETLTILGVESENVDPSYQVLYERVHPDDRARFDQVRLTSIKEGRDFEAEFRLLLPGGAIKYVHGIGHCLKNEPGKHEYIGALMDITERKRAQEALRRSEAFLAGAQHLSRTGSFSWHVETGTITWSQELYRIFGFDPGVSPTLDLIRARVHPDDVASFDEEVSKRPAQGKGFEYEHRLQMPDQSVKHLKVVAHATRDPDGCLEYVGAIQDITEHRLVQESLSKMQLELARVARITSIGVMSASVAHEVNQPLSGIVTNSSTCLRMLSSDPPNIAGALKTVERTIRDANRASDVIRRLRTLFRKSAAADELLDLNDATREVIALSSGKVRSDRIIVRTELADDIPLIRGDRVQLQQVMLNLLQNACDAMSAVDGRPKQLTIRTERGKDDDVCLSVKDAGVGLESANLDLMFESFYSTKSNGMGIGLSVSRSIIESHHGRLWAEPNDGPGATFSFSIPRQAEV
jgi:signal transduction histidine kinase/DNA-binding transcriptional MerR regulator